MPVAGSVSSPAQSLVQTLCNCFGLQIRTAVLYRLGLPVFRQEGPYVAGLTLSDRYGDHAVTCAAQGERISRHIHLRDAIFTAAASALLSLGKEERAILPGKDHRPADVLLPLWDWGRDMVLDITVVSPFQRAYLER